MSDWFKGSLLLAATLSAGFAIGFWVAKSHNAEAVSVQLRSAPVEVMHQHVMHTLNQSLKLDSAQHAAIMETLHRNQSLVDSAWSTMRPHVNAHLNTTHAEIMKILTPEQRKIFDRLTAHGHHGR